MDYSALERSLIEVMEEQQAKLGFDGNAVYLFYPMSSVAMTLGVPAETETVTAALKGFCVQVREKLGELSYVAHGDRVSFVIPPQGGEYIRSLLDEKCFIVRLIRLVSSHHADIEEVIALFREYSDRVCVRHMPKSEEFDYLVYFEDGIPDAFFYCLKEEMGHVTYHRFTKMDFEAFGFELTEDDP